MLDTTVLDQRDRAEAVVAAMLQAKVPAQLTHEVRDLTQIHARLDLWELGSRLSLLRRSSSGIGLSRTVRQTRAFETDRIAVSVLSPGSWTFSQCGHTRRSRPDRWELLLIDHSAPYEFARREDGTTVAFNVDLGALDIPADLVRHAVPHVQHSPMAGLMTRYLVDLGSDIDHIIDGAARAAALTATTDLLRALILTTSRDPLPHRAAPGESLLPVITLYLRKNCLDPTLTPGRVARIHDISVRQLYSVWAAGASGTELSLAEWILKQRVDAAQQMLIAAGSRHLTIAAIARRCGFVDAAHFSRRFKSAFGCTPREWRQLNAFSDELPDSAVSIRGANNRTPRGTPD